MISTRNISPIWLHALILTALGFLIFSGRASNTLVWLDGQYNNIIMHQQHEWMSHTHLGMNLFQGLGDITFPIIFRLIPACYLATAFSQHLHPIIASHHFAVLLYTCLSVQYFIGAYLINRVFHIPRSAALIAGWGITLLVFPFIPVTNHVLFYPITAIAPFAINVFFCEYLCLYSFAQVGKGSRLQTIGSGVVAILLQLYLALYAGLSVIVALPFTACVAVVLLLFADTSRERLAKIVTIIIGLTLLFYLKYPQFMLGMFLYTVWGFFSDTFASIRLTPQGVSILFAPATAVVGACVAGLGLAGAGIHLFVGAERDTKKYAAVFLGLTGCMILSGLVKMVIYDNQPHNSGIVATLYYEMIIWPLYMGYAVMLITLLTKQIVPIAMRQQDATLYIIPCLIALSLFQLLRHPGVSFDWSRLQSMPPLLKTLAPKLALQRDRPFQGSVAAFYPAVSENRPSNWDEQYAFDGAMYNQQGYSYRDGLWYYNIPTLFEYNQILSPALYWLSIKTLARPIDQQIRNVIAYTKINVPLLQTLGVSYVITNTPLHLPAIRLVTSHRVSPEQGTLYLYQLPHPNLATYSPTHLRPLRDIDAFFKAVNQQVIAFDQVAYVDPAVSQSHSNTSFTPATQASMTPIRDGFRVSAASTGTSALLIPIQFSHCLQVKAVDRATNTAQLIRANFLESLLIFKRHLNVDVTYKYGLLKHADCRLVDTHALKALLATHD